MSVFSIRRTTGPPFYLPFIARFALWVVLLCLVCSFAGCSRDSTEKSASKEAATQSTVTVTVAKAVEGDAPVELRVSGTVRAYSVVAVKPQVTGRMKSVHFKEGGEVRQGDLLFSIDSRPFEMDLEKARADLGKHTARLHTIRKEVDNYASMLKKGFIARARYEEVVAAAEALEAEIRADRAALEGAEMRLKLCSVYSPLDGVAGELRANPGSVVQADRDSLVVIRQVNPVYVSFSLPQQDLPALKRNSSKEPLELSARAPGAEERLVKGELSFVDNRVDTGSGTVALKGTFPNEGEILWPGQSVEVTLRLPGGMRAVAVPRRAIRQESEGPYAVVVKQDHTVEHRSVRIVGDGENESVLVKGIEPGETVVTEEQAKLAPGSLVRAMPEERQKPDGARH